MTITAVPVEVAAELSQKALDYITELLEDNYALDDILEFLAVYNSDELIAYYIEYVEMGDKVGFDVVDAWLLENDISDVPRVEEIYMGEYDSAALFAEQYFEDLYDIPSALVIDWEETFQQSLSYDFEYISGYVFQSNW